MAGCFRTVDASDAERFIGAIAAVLQCYAPDVIQHVCDPRTGLPGTMKWMPSVAEVKTACDDRCAAKARKKRFDNWGSNDADDRERQKDQGRLPPPREQRLSLAELKAKYPPDWGINTGPTDYEKMVEKLRAEGPAAPRPVYVLPTAEQLVEHYSTHSLSMMPKGDTDCPTQPERIIGDAPVIIDNAGNVLDGGADF